MSSQSRLIPVSYYNSSQEVRLSAYADTIVYEQESPSKKVLRAIRFGGYPEMVRGLADAVYAGATLDARVGDKPMCLESQVKRYAPLHTGKGDLPRLPLLLQQGGDGAMSYIGGGMYYAEPCPECGSTLWNGRCENPDCEYHWRPKTDDGDPPRRDAEDEE